jgi:hypothetical protein
VVDLLAVNLLADDAGDAHEILSCDVSIQIDRVPPPRVRCVVSDDVP